MLLLGIDFETQSDDTANTNVTEVGALLVECTHPEGENQTFRTVEELCTLVYEPTYPPQTQKIIDITAITDEMLKTKGVSNVMAFRALVPLIERADYVFAHNKKFDEPVFLSTCERYKIEAPRKPWICTFTEIDYPPQFRCKQLAHLAFDHDIVFDRKNLHRALDDVKLMMFLLAKYPIGDVLKYASEPWVYIQAIFPAPFESKIGFEVGRTKAAKLGFGWEKAKGDEREFPKKWVKRVKQRYADGLQADADLLDLKVRVLPV